MNNYTGENIRRQREARAWTQAHLAEAAGVTERTIQRAEAGKPLQVESLQAIAGALNVDHTSLTEEPTAGSDVPKPDPQIDVIRLERIETALQLTRLLTAQAVEVKVLIEQPTIAQGDLIAELEQWLCDAMQLWDELAPLERQSLAKDVQRMVDNLKGIGLVVAAANRSSRLRRLGSEERFTIELLLVSISEASEPKPFVLWDKKQTLRFR